MTVQCEQSVDRPPSFSHVVNTNLITTSDYIESVFFPLDSEAMIAHLVLLHVGAASTLVGFLAPIGADVMSAAPVSWSAAGSEVCRSVKASEQSDRLEGPLHAVLCCHILLGPSHGSSLPRKYTTNEDRCTLNA
jgi:hypothetical protein